MNTFTIDFTELSFLAEACIPPRPIARMWFWKSLTDQYWEQMVEWQRAKLFEWLQRNLIYQKSLEEKNEDLLVFHARFDPDNQYMVTYNHEGKVETVRTFKMSDSYYVNSRKRIPQEYITEVKKLEVKTA